VVPKVVEGSRFAAAHDGALVFLNLKLGALVDGHLAGVARACTFLELIFRTNFSLSRARYVNGAIGTSFLWWRRKEGRLDRSIKTPWSRN
jgi:hypothetical protein